MAISDTGFVFTSGTGVAWTMKMVLNSIPDENTVNTILSLDDKYVLVIMAKEAQLLEPPLPT